MKINRILLATFIAAALSTGCSKPGDVPDTGKEQQVTQTTEITLADGALTARIPADMQPLVEQGGVRAYADASQQNALSVISGPWPGGEEAVMFQQTLNNMKRMDSAMQVTHGDDVRLGNTPVKTAEITMTTAGTPVFVVMAFGRMDNQLVTLQVTGPQDQADAVRARAKAIFSSVAETAK